MPRFRWVLGALVFGLAGALVGVAPHGVSAVAARSRCRATAFVPNLGSGTVSTIDVKSRIKNPTDITVGPEPFGVTVTRTARPFLVTHANVLVTPVPGSVSTIDVKTRTKDPNDIPVGLTPLGVTVAPYHR